MQKVIRRTMLAEKQAARRLAKKRAKNLGQEMRNTKEQARLVYQEVNKEKKAAALARREDWMLGPLAPKRDVGDLAGSYGTLSMNRSAGPLLTPPQQRAQMEIIGGKGGIVEGDRVAILQGRDKGSIGKVTKVDYERAECTVEGMNMVDVSVPDWMLEADNEAGKPRKIRSMEQPIHFSGIKLVIRLQNSQTGEFEDVVCDKVELGRPRFGSCNRFVRLPDGTKVNIPNKSDQEPKEPEDQPGDTLRVEVEQKTYVPTLLRPPMPGSVIDELRNKYSVFRTRHDPEYIAAKMKEDEEKEERKRLIRKMRTPLKEINRLERKIKRAKGKGKLTDDMMEKLGKVIAEKKQLQLAAAGVGVSKEPEPEPEPVAA